jgi:hypothetical protein
MNGMLLTPHARTVFAVSRRSSTCSILPNFFSLYMPMLQREICARFSISILLNPAQSCSILLTCSYMPMLHSV